MHGNNSAQSSREKVEIKVTDDYQSSSSRSNEEIIIQESFDPSADNTSVAASSSKKESGDLSANSDKLKNNPTDNTKQASTQSYWYEVVNKNGEKYYWNETTMTATKRKPKGLLLPVQESKPVHSHKGQTMIISSLADFLNLEDVSFSDQSRQGSALL